MVPAVVTGQDKIGSHTAEFCREQQLRVGYDDVVGVRAIIIDYESSAPVSSLPRERRNHLPRSPQSVTKKIPPSTSSSETALAQSPAATERLDHATF
jgi:hypothetical protein